MSTESIFSNWVDSPVGTDIISKGTECAMIGIWGYDINGDMTDSIEVSVNITENTPLETVWYMLIEKYEKLVHAPRKYYYEGITEEELGRKFFNTGT